MRGRSLLSGLLAALALLLQALPVAAGEPNWPPSMLIATASPGGTYHVYGMALARLLSRSLGLSVAELPTEGPNQNALLVDSGAVQIGFVTMGAALNGWNGAGDWTGGKQLRSLRALFPMYDTPFTFVVAKNSPIDSIGRMAGSRIGVGPAAGTAGYYVPKFLAALKIEATLVHGSYDELAAQMREGRIDVLAAAAGAPFPALAGLDAQQRIKFVSLGKAEITALRLAIPELAAAVIPAGGYPSLRKDYATVGLFNFAVVHKSLPDNLAYGIVETVFREHEALVQAHGAAAETLPKNFYRNNFLPYHPGAMRYFSNHTAGDVVQGD